MNLSDRESKAQLSDRHAAWLAKLPPIQMMGEILLCHGSPKDDLEYLLEDVNGVGAQLASPERIRTRLGDVKASLVLCGHTHIPRAVSLPGGVWIVNPGSVGLQAFEDNWTSLHYVETGSPHARYAIVDWEPKAMRVDFIALDYDWEAASKEAARSNRLDWAHALATGYALRASQPPREPS
jgi:predicted phosphodiesterase